MNRRFSGLLVITFLLISLLSSGMIQSSTEVVPAEEDIKAILLDYSKCLSTGQISKDYYSPMMRDLIQERRNFYKEFFDIGLHSDLFSVGSDFTAGSILEDNQQANLYVRATEKVTLYGKYRCSSPEEYPLVKSGRLALLKTNDPAVKNAIEGYIESIVGGVNESIEEGGFEIVFILRHDLVISSNEKGLKIVQDSFTDAANDNPGGNDNVNWVNGRFVRCKPDLTKMPDYMIYNTPIQEMAESLLDTYSRIYGEEEITPLGYPPQYHYYHSQAAAYINTWTKNTTITCNPNLTISRERQ